MYPITIGRCPTACDCGMYVSIFDVKYFHLVFLFYIALCFFVSRSGTFLFICFVSFGSRPCGFFWLDVTGEEVLDGRQAARPASSDPRVRPPRLHRRDDRLPLQEQPAEVYRGAVCPYVCVFFFLCEYYMLKTFFWGWWWDFPVPVFRSRVCFFFMCEYYIL